MTNINEAVLYLLIFNIYIVSIHSYEDSNFVNDDNDITEILHQTFIDTIPKRDKRAVGDNSTLPDDGSGFMTSENT